MRLLTFLVEREAVSTPKLAEALVVQRQSRPPLGVLAQEAGDMTAEQVESVLVLQRYDRMRRFGELALELGYLDAHQLDRNLRIQQTRQKSLLRVLIDMECVKSDRAGELARMYTSASGNPHERDIDLACEVGL